MNSLPKNKSIMLLLPIVPPLDYNQLCMVIEEIMARKDPWNHHGLHVADTLLKMSQYMNVVFTPTGLEQLNWIGRLHDLGKLFFPDSLLNHPRTLTETEFQSIRNHVKLGYDLAVSIGVDPKICKVILQHHENVNGTGYPMGLKYSELCEEALMLRVADTFDAITSDRSYRKPRAISDAIQILRAESGIIFDPISVEALIKSLDWKEE